MTSDNDGQEMLVDQVTMDLQKLENRVAELERTLSDNCNVLPPVIQELKSDVEKFRERLETTKHISWLSCYKDLPPTNRRLQYRRQSDARQRQVREKFLKICEESISEEVRQCLRLPSFDCCDWQDEEIMLLLQFMFLDFDFPAKFNIDMNTLRNFLFQVYKNYNEVPFHNFRHCFCVSQMMYAMACKVDLPSKIGDLETLILITSCICHDLDHPGYNNIYQINARTELALRYNDISPLENHHCSMAFRILELPECNIFSSFTPETFRVVREGIIRCILATDMARHNEILAQFKEAVSDGFDYTNKTHVNLLTMVLIKVADISNEARPMEVAEPWLDKLLQEFFAQSNAEKQEGLPVTPFMDPQKITKPSSQCSFIGFVLLPLFEALGELFLELQPMIVEPVRDALEYYRRLNEAAKDEQRMHRKSIIQADFASQLENASASVPSSPTQNAGNNMDIVKSHSGNMRKTSICLSQHAEDPEDMLGSEDLLPELSEDSEEEETVTEVAVSEKTLKFKISTESSSSGRKSYPGSRKGSREKTHQLAEQELARMLRDQERSIRSSDSGDKRSWSSGEQGSDERRCGRCGNEEKKETRSMSLADHDWRRDFMTVQLSKKARSTSAGSPEGLREFRGKDSNSTRRTSPMSPKDTDDTSRDIGSFEDSSEGKDMEYSLKSSCLGIIKEGCVQGEDLEDPKDEILIVINGGGKSSDNTTVETSDSEVLIREDLKDEAKYSDASPDEKSARKSPSSILRKLKSIGERFSRSSTIELGSPKGSTDRSILIPASPASLKSHKVNASSSVDSDRRAMTLPKASRKKAQLKREKGWKGLLRSKVSMDQDGDTSSSKEDASCDEARAGTSERVANGLTPPEESLESGSEERGSHNNNRSQSSKVPGSDERDESESPNMSRGQHWMSSLVSTFRSRKSQSKEESAKT
ncbi:high affinity cGMP-specific 3',5'-cyclic phosphodiesterase 9A isoform X2 [Macrosteles quadrilineatus]|uniref:high affinity cGMP-specific 3',5'-cyclic phosphodiesterase 9A isoform X2 n=1 Tax=Macrosteles quadrilineatus TaxID=74068 RepID=UPI0023E0A2FB|nr:high affinity cGMP-specific 3',5'-cyclic phosphodiesterase 9A isoform X2 [Macrosteles quadrilineatus]